MMSGGSLADVKRMKQAPYRLLCVVPTLSLYPSARFAACSFKVLWYTPFGVMLANLIIHLITPAAFGQGKRGRGLTGWWAILSGVLVPRKEGLLALSPRAAIGGQLLAVGRSFTGWVFGIEDSKDQGDCRPGTELQDPPCKNMRETGANAHKIRERKDRGL
ncbi:hypothetical protein OPQ81_005353 [Rhizoctonia solani]|nr:hypothetical protein OPQ81_005353 [Rhizoctonia solani]